MPRFFFDLATPRGVERDDVGVVFASMEAAYLDACRAALEISIEMLRNRQDPDRHSFEVRDERVQLVLEIPFAEVLQPQGRVAVLRTPSRLHHQIAATVGRSRALRTELAEELMRARCALETAQATLKRAS